MAIEFTERRPTQQQYWDLFATTGWNEKYKLSPEELFRGMEHSWYVVGVYDGERLVGFARVITDTIVHAMVYDVITIPEYQGQRIASRVMEMVMAKCKAAGIRDVQLFSARGKRAFYEKRGFVARPEDGPGMQYEGW